MKIKTLSAAITAIIITLSTFAFASNSTVLKEKNVTYYTMSATDTSETGKIGIGAFGEIMAETKGVGEDVPDYIRRPKAFPKGFTGYKVEIKTVYNQPLSLNNDLFKEFGGMMIERRTENSYTYLLGEFEDKDAVETYLKKVILSRYPDAKGVKYKNGTIIDYK